MRVVFRVISTGAGGSKGASRATRYIAERDKDLAREGPGPRPLFSDEPDSLTYRKADRILDPLNAQPLKDDLIHLSVSFEEDDFNKLGSDEKQKQARLKEVIREGMRGMARELNVERLTWIAGIHRNTDNPHAHVLIYKDTTERGTSRFRRLGRLRKSLLPYKTTENGREMIVPGAIGERFLSALDKQQSLYLQREPFQHRAERTWDDLIQRIQQTDRTGHARETESRQVTQGPSPMRNWKVRADLNYRQIASSWSETSAQPETDLHRYRIALGKHLSLSMRLQFTQIWYDRAVEHGETYRFNVVDESINEERKISELDVQRRAAARATRNSQRDHAVREQAIDTDLNRHSNTLRDLRELREAKIDALQKDIAGLGGRLSKLDKIVSAAWRNRDVDNRTPLIDRNTLSELQEQAVRLNLPEEVSELERLRVDLAGEHRAPIRLEAEAGKLMAHQRVTTADFMAREARIQSFDAAVHLTHYEVHDERWSLATIDRQIAIRSEDTKLIPRRAARLDLRSLARLNYSSEERERATEDVTHLRFIRGEIVRQIDERRTELIEERNRAKEMLDVLSGIQRREQEQRHREGKTMPQPIYDAKQVHSLEASAETIRDPKLLQLVHEWEKAASKDDREIDWQGRAIAREIMSEVAVLEAKQRLENFVENKKVSSLHLADHTTGTLREVEARTITEYLARTVESREHRDHRHAIKSAARDDHRRLMNDVLKTTAYHEAARELASEAQGREPKFTDKEKIELEIYAERQNGEAARERYLRLGRDTAERDREVAVSQSR